MKDCFTTDVAPECLREYMAYVYSLPCQHSSDYGRMKQMFHKELASRGLRDDGKTLDWITSGKKVRGAYKQLKWNDLCNTHPTSAM